MIMNALFPKASELLINQAVERFWELREEMKKNQGGASKKISTSELIDWFKALRRYPEDEALAKLNGKLPYPGVLLKSWEDHIRYLKLKNNG